MFYKKNMKIPKELLCALIFQSSEVFNFHKTYQKDKKLTIHRKNTQRIFINQCYGN